MEREITSQLLYNVCVQVPPEVLVTGKRCNTMCCMAAGRHLHHHQMHHRQGQATLSVLPETMEGAEIATASQLSGVSPGPPPTHSSRRPARRSSAHAGPLLAHSHHRAHLREQAAQLDDWMQRRSIVSSTLAFVQLWCGLLLQC